MIRNRSQTTDDIAHSDTVIPKNLQPIQILRFQTIQIQRVLFIEVLYKKPPTIFQEEEQHKVSWIINLRKLKRTFISHLLLRSFLFARNLLLFFTMHMLYYYNLTPHHLSHTICIEPFQVCFNARFEISVPVSGIFYTKITNTRHYQMFRLGCINNIGIFSTVSAISKLTVHIEYEALLQTLF